MKMRKNALIALGLAGIMTVGGIMAYFTDTDTETNTVEIGRVEIDQTEPSWPGNDSPIVENVLPNQVIPKDPTITNIGDNDAYVFFTVTVPVADVIATDDAGVKQAKAVQELFKYNVNPGWVHVGNALKVMDSAGNHVANKHLYAWGTASAMTALTPTSSTKALFDNITILNMVEDQTLPTGATIEDSIQDMQVASFAIQTTDLNGHGATAKTSPSAVWAIIDNQREIIGDFNVDTSVKPYEDATKDYINAGDTQGVTP